MKTWVKKQPNTYKAVQYDGTNEIATQINKWLGGLIHDLYYVGDGPQIRILSLQNKSSYYLNPGEWIVLDTVTGAIKVYDDMEFKDLFEELDETK